jgi:type IV pilus modification protein PilV
MRHGFTLLEVLIALVILMVGILGLAPLFISAPRYNQSSQAITEAATLAQSKFEELKSLDYSTINNGQDNVQGSKGIIFARQWVVAAQGNSKTVRCILTWTDWIGHRVEFFYAYSDL